VLAFEGGPHAILPGLADPWQHGTGEVAIEIREEIEARHVVMAGLGKQ
jgi:hypothetical protein